MDETLLTEECFEFSLRPDEIPIFRSVLFWRPFGKSFGQHACSRRSRFLRPSDGDGDIVVDSVDHGYCGNGNWLFAFQDSPERSKFETRSLVEYALLHHLLCLERFSPRFQLSQDSDYIVAIFDRVGLIRQNVFKSDFSYVDSHHRKCR